jgi:hypothetical protein
MTSLSVGASAESDRPQLETNEKRQKTRIDEIPLTLFVLIDYLLKHWK